MLAAHISLKQNSRHDYVRNGLMHVDPYVLNGSGHRCVSSCILKMCAYIFPKHKSVKCEPYDGPINKTGCPVLTSYGKEAELPYDNVGSSTQSTTKTKAKWPACL